MNKSIQTICQIFSAEYNSLICSSQTRHIYSIVDTQQINPTQTRTHITNTWGAPHTNNSILYTTDCRDDESHYQWKSRNARVPPRQSYHARLTISGIGNVTAYYAKNPGGGFHSLCSAMSCTLTMRLRRICIFFSPWTPEALCHCAVPGTGTSFGREEK